MAILEKVSSNGHRFERDESRLMDDLDEIDLVLFDCDGVIYQGDSLLPGVDRALDRLRSLGKHFKFITNTSARSRDAMYAKFRKLGLSDPLVRQEDCLPSGVCAAKHLKENCTDIKRVYVAGSIGLVQELENAGFECLGGPDDDGKIMTESEFIRIANEDPLVDAVVVGYDQAFNYYKLSRASLCFQKNSCCKFIATNDDVHDVVGGNWLLPGNGAMLESLIKAVQHIPGVIDQQPQVTGKPDPLFGNLAINCAGLEGIDPRRVLVIGDKLETDILLAKNCGFRSCLVLTGVARPEDIATSSIKPDYVIEGVFVLAK